jgi:hypothetical protein
MILGLVSNFEGMGQEEHTLQIRKMMFLQKSRMSKSTNFTQIASQCITNIGATKTIPIAISLFSAS